MIVGIGIAASVCADGDAAAEQDSSLHRLRLTGSVQTTTLGLPEIIFYTGVCVSDSNAAGEVYPEINSGSQTLDSREDSTISREYGLHHGVLSPMETLAQSISAIAPSTSPALTIPLVVALSGNGTWLVYLLTTTAVLLVGFCISRFARMTASPGSLYSYAADTLPPSLGAVAAWAMLLAYVATGASVAGATLYYGNVILNQFFAWSMPGLPTLILVFVPVCAVAYRDVKLSAELMLWIEVVSVSLIAVVLALVLIRHGFHLDMDQVHLKDFKPGGLGPALVLAMFSYVGFESATALGSEARNPLKTIPRAVLQSAVVVGLFFTISAYSEVLGFHGEIQNLSDPSISPMHILARKVGISPMGTAIDFGAFVAGFACVLACTTASARVMLRMAHSGLLPDSFARTHLRFGTPVRGVIVTGILMFAISAPLIARGASGPDIYGWLGSISVFGFLTAYALVAIALPFARNAIGQHSNFILAVSVLTTLVMVAGIVGTIYPIPDAPVRWFPYIYIAYIAAGLIWFMARRKTVLERRNAVAATEL
jgi:amino acid transporter